MRYVSLILTFLSFTQICQLSTLAARPAPPSWRVSEVGPDHRVYHDQKEPAGSNANFTDSEPRRIVEIESGMNYWNGSEWVASEAVFDLNDQGFGASKLQFEVQLASQLNRPGAVTLVTRDGKELRSTPVAIGLFDAKSGKSLVIGAITNSLGALAEPNKVVYEHAFTGVDASVVYTLQKGSFEQDLILSSPIHPEDYGFPTNTTRIQIFTEFYNVPAPERTKRPLRTETDEKARAKMASPDFVDENLLFGEMLFGSGRASKFSPTGRKDGPEARVAKEFRSIGERTFLIESVEYGSVKTELRAATKGLKPSQRRIALKAVPSPSSMPVFAEKGRKVASADFKAPNGFLIDYRATISTPVPGIYRGDTTYIVAGPVYCGAGTTIEAGAVFKYKYVTPTQPYLHFSDSPICKTQPYRPAYFTGLDDDTVGESAAGITGYNGVINLNKYGNPGIWLDYPGTANLNDLRFRHLQEAIRIEGDISSAGIAHSHFANCIRGINLTGIGSGGGTGTGTGTSGISLEIKNDLFTQVKYPITVNEDSSTVSFINCTVDKVLEVTAAGTVYGAVINAAAQYSSVTFVNCILANASALSTGTIGSIAGNNNGFYNYTGTALGPAGTRYTTATSPFISHLGGSYYLAVSSNLRNVGTPSGLSATALADIRARTTSPPILWGSPISTVSYLSQVTPRDLDAIDLGYHYDALDYTLNAVAVSASVTLAPGVCVAIQNNYGISIQSGGSVNCEGSARRMNHVASLGNVQETAVGQGLTFVSLNGSSGSPSLNFRFSEISLGQGTPGTIVDTGASAGYPFTTLSLRDCWLFDAWIKAYPATGSAISAQLVNNLIVRSKMEFGHASGSVNTSLSLNIYNNLFLFTPDDVATVGTPASLTLVYDNGSVNPAWHVHDNFFDRATQSVSGSGKANIAHSHNAFTTSTTVSVDLTSIYDQTSFSAVYSAGPLGNYYLAASGKWINKGSRTASEAGLYHHTMRVDETPEAGTQVDIGFHYVSTACKALDTIWIEDSLPFTGTPSVLPPTEVWTWVNSNPTSFSGQLAFQSPITAGYHLIWFSGGSPTMSVNAGDSLIAYVYLDPANPPTEVMLQWNNGDWGHRAYWGANNISLGTDGTADQRYMGPLPATGQWVRLVVPASQVALEGSVINGYSPTLFGGRATFDAAGKTGGSHCYDTDGDGLPDYLEDTNGNGIFDSGTDFGNLAVANSDNDADGLNDPWEYSYFASLSAQNGAGDYDGDGISNLMEYWLMLNPTFNEVASPGTRRDYTYDLLNRLRVSTGTLNQSITVDKEDNITAITL
jgi:hypothetical protein